MSFNSIEDIIRHYRKEGNPLDRPSKILEDSKARYEDAKQRKLDYIAARQNAIEVEQERLRMMGVVDISEQEN